MRQPDIEIYLKEAKSGHEHVVEWLSKALGPCTPWVKKGQVWKCTAGGIPVTWMPNAVGKWNSLYLDSDQTPWDDDIACAQAAFKALNVEVRCAPGTWEEEQGEADADRWIRISEDGQEEITWKTNS
ncbi:hypothetical protein FJD38_10830 [Pseudomonas saxonica]|uniref:DUF3085 domain-containing protein n=1 Tax=Pseudomonas saxonica TaxID=2600598 RepID=A0ABY3GHZ2_9PSED|nr:hypothetical protein [Pseudomonas saxonica]TWR90004.1 hypothetical protein FJD38_10830 [Pseudomonas saxonica]